MPQVWLLNCWKWVVFVNWVFKIVPTRAMQISGRICVHSKIDIWSIYWRSLGKCLACIILPYDGLKCLKYGLFCRHMTPWCHAAIQIRNLDNLVNDWSMGLRGINRFLDSQLHDLTSHHIASHHTTPHPLTSLKRRSKEDRAKREHQGSVYIHAWSLFFPSWLALCSDVTKLRSVGQTKLATWGLVIKKNVKKKKTCSIQQ